jgi:hypothetical protein
MLRLPITDLMKTRLAQQKAFSEGREEGRQQGPRAEVRLSLRQLHRCVGPLPADEQARIGGLGPLIWRLWGRHRWTSPTRRTSPPGWRGIDQASVSRKTAGSSARWRRAGRGLECLPPSTTTSPDRLATR